MKAALRHWRLWLERERQMFSLRLYLLCPPGECSFVAIDAAVLLLYGCTNCGRTHVCGALENAESTATADWPGVDDGDGCHWGVNSEERYFCRKSLLLAVNDAVLAKFSSFAEYDRYQTTEGWRDLHSDDDYEDEDGDAPGDEDEDAARGQRIGDLIKIANADYEYAAQRHIDGHKRQRAADTLTELHSMAHEAREVDRRERHRLKAEAMGRTPNAARELAASNAAAKSTISKLLDTPSEAELRERQLTPRQREFKRRGFPRRDLEFWDKVVFTPQTIENYTGQPWATLSAIFKQPTAPATFSTLFPPAPPTPLDLVWQWSRRPNRMRAAMAVAPFRPMCELVTDDWLKLMATVVATAGVVPGPACELVDLLGRWVALIHATAPKEELPPLRVFAAYVCLGGAERGILGRDGHGATWPLVPAMSELAARAATLFNPVPSLAKGKRKDMDARTSTAAGSIIRALFLPLGHFTGKQVKAVWERMVKVVDVAHFVAPWYFDWFHGRSRRCWPIDRQIDSPSALME